MRSRSFRRAGALLLTLALAVSLVPAARADVTGVRLDKTDLTLKVGGTTTAQLTATVYLETGDDTSDQTVTWESSNPSIVTVEDTDGDNTAEVALVGGDAVTKTVTVTITATSTVNASHYGQCTVTVQPEDPPPPPPVHVERVTLNRETLNLMPRETATLTARVEPDNATEKGIDWSSSAEGVATVNNGRVTAVAVGEAVITAASKDTANGEIKAACRVTVTAVPVIVPVESVEIETGGVTTVEVGLTLELSAVVSPENATTPGVTWSSRDEDVATVDDSGVVTGVKAGTASITVKTDDGGKKASVLITVVDSSTSFMVTPSRGSSPINTGLVSGRPPLNLIAVTGKAVTWRSENPEIADVSANGDVTGYSPGTTTIVAEAADGARGEYLLTVSGLVLDQTELRVVVGSSETLAYKAYGAAAESNDAPRWTANPESVATVSNGGRVTGMAPGITTVTVTKGRYTAGECKVTVEEDVADAIESALNAGEKLDFPTLLAELNSRCQDRTGAALDYITNLEVSPGQGVLHYRYGSPDIPNHGVGGVDRYYATAASDSDRRAISDLSFVPNGSFKGTAVIEYTGYSTEGQAFHGTIRVDVKNSGDVTYSTAQGRTLTLSAREFRDICQLKTSRNASYVTFTQPSGNRGTLYYNYTPGQYSPKVDSTTRYYLNSSPSLEDVTFVPAEGFTGTVTVPYRCTDTTGGSYSGTMTINIYSADGEASGGVEYTTGINQRLTLNAADFNDACAEINDRSLNYLYFDELPDAAKGTLYYNYTSASSNRVDTATRYSRGGTGSRISSITFVPASGFSGTVTIPYTGYDTAGQSYRDNLVIHVSDAAGTVYYTTEVGDPVTFRGEDFNDACQNSNGSTLNYLQFTLPSSSVGTLYRNYRSSSNPGTRLSSSTRLYRGGTPGVSDVTFVPRNRYEGTVSIPFSGVDAGGTAFEGTVSISVGRGVGQVVRYTTASGGVARFNAADFNAVCRSATGDDLNYLSFEPPASRYGTLYYQYNASRGSGTQVTSSSTYYRSGSGRLISDVSFASANVNGVASFQFTGRSAGGRQFTGTVEITIGNAGLDGASSGTRYIGSASPIALRTADFEYACQSAVGGALSHIRFDSLPSESAGRLYMNYESPSRPGGAATTTSNYTAGSGLTIGQLSFVPKAGYQGQVSIPYTGYNTSGGSFRGNVVIDISNSYCATPFYDVDTGWEWAKPSVEFLRSAGITNGYSNGSFCPSRSISRGEFTLMVCRAFGFDTTAASSNFPDVPAGSPYAGAVATARSMGIVEGNGGRFQPDSPITRQSAMTIICRAMRAAGEQVPSRGASALNAFSDQAQIASHARDSVAALASLGVVQGNSSMQINPRRSITRAEMAVILHRVLTL